MSRLLGMFLFAAVICAAADCHAQHQRGWMLRRAAVQRGASQNDTCQPQDQIQNSESSPIRHYQMPSSNYHSQTSPYSNSAEAYPKYYGGFHSSHFNNLGIPPGDIGFRGNSIYWSPW